MIINAQLKNGAMDRKGAFPRNVNPFSRTVALWRASAASSSPVQARASYLYELVKLASIEIGPGWTLAGNHLPTEGLALQLPDPADPEDVRLMRELSVREEEFPSVAKAINRWEARPEAPRDDAFPEDSIGQGPWGDVGPDRVFIGAGWVENHSIRDYEKLIRVGFNALRREIETEMSRADTDGPDYADKHSFWLASLTICDAGILLGGRYAQEAARLAELADSPEDRQRLERIAEACKRVPAAGARTLAEAVQSLLLLHILSCGEDGINANSLGRLDQILFSYYAADMKAGRLDRTGALALMEEHRCAHNGRYFVHLFWFMMNVPFGRDVGATPDGRRQDEPLAYSLSPYQGRDVEGVTAVLNSLARVPHNRAAGATAAIIDINPDLLSGTEGVQRLTHLTQTAIAMGIGQLQWNVTTVERLRKAQEDPEKYGNIAVRVAGYSQMFKLVPKDLQDHIIARTKHER